LPRETGPGQEPRPIPRDRGGVHYPAGFPWKGSLSDPLVPEAPHA
jgi:hypothetical protein